jgi:hypothetical protein
MKQNVPPSTYCFTCVGIPSSLKAFSKLRSDSGSIRFMINIENPVLNMKCSMIGMKIPISEMENFILDMKECMFVKQNSMSNLENFMMNMNRFMFIMK